MNKSHTPGPWEARTFMVKGGDRMRDTICHVGSSTSLPPSRSNESIANARLIAAAPDMLAALQKLDASWTETFPDGPDGNRQWAGGFGTLSDETCEIWRAIRDAIAKATEPTT